MAEQKIRTFFKTKNPAANKRGDMPAGQREQRELRERKREEQSSTAQKIGRKLSGVGGAVGGFLKNRADAIAHESRDIRPHKQNYGGHIPSGPIDPFGMGQMGNPFAPPRPEPAPRRKRRKRTSAPPRRAPSRPRMDMMGVPKDMRWMF